MSHKNNFWFHIITILIVGIWGTTFISTQILMGDGHELVGKGYKGFTPHEIYLARFVVAYIGMCFLAKKKLFADNWKDELLLMLGGLTGGSFYFWTENMALKHTMANNVSFILCTTPLITMMLNIMINKNEKATKGFIWGSVVSLIGVALVIFNGQFVLKVSPIGDFLALLTSLSWGVYSIVMKKLFEKYDTSFITRKVFFYGLVTILPLFIIEPWSYDLKQLLQPVVLGNFLFLSILASLICFAVWNVMLKKLDVVITSNYLYLTPLFTLVGAYLVLGDTVTPIAMAGMLMILGGVIYASKKESEKNKRIEEMEKAEAQ